MDEVLAFMQKHGLPLSMPLDEVVAVMERAERASQPLKGRWQEIYEELDAQIIRDSPENEKLMADLYDALALRDDTGTTLEMVRLKKAQQKLDNLGREEHGPGRSFRYKFRPDGLVDREYVLELRKADTPTDHRTFLDAMEAE